MTDERNMMDERRLDASIFDPAIHQEIAAKQPGRGRRLLLCALFAVALQYAGALFMAGNRLADKPEVAGEILGRLIGSMFIITLVVYLCTRRVFPILGGTILLFVLGSIITVGASLGKQEQRSEEEYEAALLECIKLCEDYTAMLKTIKNDETARTALELQDVHRTRLVVFQEKVKKIPAGRQSELDRISKKHEARLKQVGFQLGLTMLPVRMAIKDDDLQKQIEGKLKEYIELLKRVRV